MVDAHDDTKSRSPLLLFPIVIMSHLKVLLMHYRLLMSQSAEVGIEPGPQDLQQTLYYVAVKAGFYRKAVEVCYIPIPSTYFPALN